MASSKLLIAALLLPLLAGDEIPQPYLAAIETKLAPDLDWEQPVRADLRVQNPEALLRSMDSSDASPLSSDSVRITLSDRPVGNDPPREQTRKASFMIDFDEPSVKRLAEELRETHGEKPEIADLVAFVARIIDNKSYERSWEIASRVASERGGDCTEHAVLLTALARASGYPSRVILGVALLVDGEQALAFGHAWSEIYAGDRWVLADATSAGEPENVYYIRESAMEDEGLGFRWALMKTLAETSVTQVHLSNATAE